MERSQKILLSGSTTLLVAWGLWIGLGLEFSHGFLIAIPGLIWEGVFVYLWDRERGRESLARMDSQDPSA